jgi:hypothetical protein
VPTHGNRPIENVISRECGDSTPRPTYQGLEVRARVDLVSELTLLSPHSRLGFFTSIPTVGFTHGYLLPPYSRRRPKTPHSRWIRVAAIV